MMPAVRPFMSDLCARCHGAATVRAHNKRGILLIICASCGASRPAPVPVVVEPPRNADGEVPWA